MKDAKLTQEELEFLGGEETKNRAQRRARKVNRLFTREGFYSHLNAIKITRKKNGKIKQKYVHLHKKDV